MLTYASKEYALSLKDFGDPLHLPNCNGWLLKRRIPGSEYFDGMGCYPLFACSSWQNIPLDLDLIGSSLVSIVLVSDPFGEYTAKDLSASFTDLAIPFKEHFVIDLKQINISKHHRYYSTRSLKKVTVDICQTPLFYLDRWSHLYSALIGRHNLKGIKAFSETSFKALLALPNVVMFKAESDGDIIGAHLWFTNGNTGYSHLAAFNASGYELMAAYALYSEAIDYFSNSLRWLDIGSGAGINTRNDDGLTQFKRGWTDKSRTAYLCGKVFNRGAYSSLVRAKGAAGSAYFPLYRLGEYA